ncbi:hypothetical protein [Halalkalibacter okhensis]|uniref:hypothetical protein n=1 Tax=Halalkalibacter okhensis TaxID=333138 RepID=UPI00068DC0A3|nr:hypothetical protein [Halalkalibacter okhensis]
MYRNNFHTSHYHHPTDSRFGPGVIGPVGAGILGAGLGFLGGQLVGPGFGTGYPAGGFGYPGFGGYGGYGYPRPPRPGYGFYGQNYGLGGYGGFGGYPGYGPRPF